MAQKQQALVLAHRDYLLTDDGRVLLRVQLGTSLHPAGILRVSSIIKAAALRGGITKRWDREQANG